MPGSGRSRSQPANHSEAKISSDLRPLCQRDQSPLEFQLQSFSSFRLASLELLYLFAFRKQRFVFFQWTIYVNWRVIFDPTSSPFLSAFHALWRVSSSR